MSLADLVLATDEDIAAPDQALQELRQLQSQRARIEHPEEQPAEAAPAEPAPFAGWSTSNKKGVEALDSKKEKPAPVSDAQKELQELRQEYREMFGEDLEKPLPPRQMPADAEYDDLKSQLKVLDARIGTLDSRADTVATELGERVASESAETRALKLQNAHLKQLFGQKQSGEAQGWRVEAQGWTVQATVSRPQPTLVLAGPGETPTELGPELGLRGGQLVGLEPRKPVNVAPGDEVELCVSSLGEAVLLANGSEQWRGAIGDRAAAMLLANNGAIIAQGVEVV